MADSPLGGPALESRSFGGFGGLEMHRFIDGEDRMQQTLLPHSLGRPQRFDGGAADGWKRPQTGIRAGAGASREEIQLSTHWSTAIHCSLLTALMSRW